MVYARTRVPIRSTAAGRFFSVQPAVDPSCCTGCGRDWRASACPHGFGYPLSSPDCGRDGFEPSRITIVLAVETSTAAVTWHASACPHGSDRTAAVSCCGNGPTAVRLGYPTSNDLGICRSVPSCRGGCTNPFFAGFGTDSTPVSGGH